MRREAERSKLDGTMVRSAHDKLNRPLKALRLSVTDRCNLRCAYCMPEEDYVWLPREGLLDFREIERVCRLFVDVGVDRLRITGGEPLLRRDLATLVASLAALPGVTEVALTTNGVLLAEHAESLARAGLARVTVSLDTLSPRTFANLTRKQDHGRVLDGIRAAKDAGLPLKLDTVVLRGVNDDELVDLLAFAHDHGAELRFIEYMDVGGATRWRPEQVLPRNEILSRIESRLGPVTDVGARGCSPAERFRLPEGQHFGVIPSVSAPFCSSCDRARLTADGHLFTCLYATRGVDLKSPLRGGATDDALRSMLADVWGSREDRGAELRREMAERVPLVPLRRLKQNPHLEMHTRGG